MIESQHIQSVKSNKDERNEEQLKVEDQHRINYIKKQDTTEEQDWYSMGVPVESQAKLNAYTKAVTCIAVDPKGHRMATGGLDSHVRLWDFHCMNKDMNSFRTIGPFTDYFIRNLSFNTSGTHLMVINGNKQITILDKDGGHSLLTFKGHMYVKDLNLTKGHINTVYDGQFHPINHNEFVTASADGSIRMWDIEQQLVGIDKELAHKSLIRCKDAYGAFVGIRSVCYSKDGKILFSGCLDGSLQIFSTKHNIHRPEMLVKESHDINEEFTSIVSFQDSQRFATRNTDGTLKVWDIRMLNRPILHERGLHNKFPGNKLCFSPDQRYLLAGTSVGKGIEEKLSYLHFYDTATLKKVKSLTVSESSIAGLCWSPAINQIIVGLANGETYIYFDKRLSSMGALKLVNKQPRVEKDSKFNYTASVYLPNYLPLQKEQPTNNKNDIKELRKDTTKSVRPIFPIWGKPYGCRPNEKVQIQIQRIIQQLNNPKKVEDAHWPDYKICPHCGLKLCTCFREEFYEQQDEVEDDDTKIR